ncbi:S-adenosyl-L-methionine-dependent methyltransferase [Trametes versicolor FP-101664 SS1]|uniref:S-adenosyl-L-methionine-dependent methyltransferase n=1 Tax=Trametes versicolor (strain FP-101664) TaxID=717944 RepID=UPI00046218DD|nr:S-adenosyl-L-methionine-dependent methyltransferase [Trametes versicolor FP-101664 SS1]EIW58504.1 S-adenosyl-L-methionine-dependent methyltransferase [Trametes versicolor FP-101664 SS1]
MADILPKKNEEYGTKEYWDQRYTQESEDASFDWFKSYSDIADIMRELIPEKSARILMLGCGNSTLSQDMYDDEYKNIVNTDYSGILIEKMRHKNAQDRPEMEWHEMDIRDLKFDDDTFDVAIDKGTMDAMMTAKADVWDPPEEVVQNCNREVDEVLRVLRKGGIFVYLTFGQPHFRRRYLDRPGTTLEIRKLGEAFHYYLYIVRT